MPSGRHLVKVPWNTSGQEWTSLQKFAGDEKLSSPLETHAPLNRITTTRTQAQRVLL